MFVVFFDLTINLDKVAAFCVDDRNKGYDGYFVKFYESSYKEEPAHCLAFQSKEIRDKIYRDILFALQSGDKVLAITTFKEEK